MGEVVWGVGFQIQGEGAKVVGMRQGWRGSCLRVGQFYWPRVTSNFMKGREVEYEHLLSSYSIPNSLYIILCNFNNTVQGRHFNPHFIKTEIKAKRGK